LPRRHRAYFDACDADPQPLTAFGCAPPNYDPAPVTRAGLAALLFLVALTTASCGARSEPTGATVQLFPVTIDGPAGPPTKLEHAPTRILAIGPEMSATLTALGVPRRFVRTGAGQAAGADLVLVWASSPEADARRPAGVPTYIAADASIRDVERSLADLGVLVGRPLAGRRVAESIQRRVSTVEQRLAGAEPVSVFLDRGFRTTYASGTLQGDMLRAAGGRSVAGSSLTQLDAAKLLRLNPRFYLATSDSATTLKSLRDDQTLKRLAAVRADRFGIVPVRELEPGARVGAGVAAIARLLHPDAFR
jgi:ABC-type Fe3+-hydroxamate transport system substrate-binding protein